jgi:hypothetical protein
VEDHIANGGAARIRAVLSTGSRENCEVSIGSKCGSVGHSRDGNIGNR